MIPLCSTDAWAIRRSAFKIYFSGEEGHALDAHLLVDIATLVATVGSGVLAVFRTCYTRITALEKDVACIKQACRDAGINVA